ncbi:MAG: ribose 5-phosphate isomerase A [Spirochaetales bacterium]|nr:ribose 5-phosphate isomerase A [Spirochaetales bacterium]
MEKSEIKKKTGIEVVNALIKDGMKIGLGTGSTMLHAIRWIKERIKQGDFTNTLFVPTSLQTELECYNSDIPFRSLTDPEIDGRLDLTIDGADEIDPGWNLIKGGGGALVVEKITGSCSSHYAIIADHLKLVNYLGETFPIPVEVFPFALIPVSKALESLGARYTVRMAEKIAGPVITKQGNILLDVSFKESFSPGEMEKTINAIPGVVDNGIFTLKVTDLFIGYPNGKVEHLSK